MTLHEAIIKLLKIKGISMTTSEIAAELNQNKWYSKGDGSLITTYQVHGRTRRYSQIFNRHGSLVTLIDQSNLLTEELPLIGQHIAISKPVQGISDQDVETKLMNKDSPRPAGSIDLIVPHSPGLYCIRVGNPDKLPDIFSIELQSRGHNIIYIGKATQSLKQRLLGQELRARGHGTFFRSLGAIMGFKPPVGSLVNKKNKRNFKFRPADEAEIIAWINANLFVNWVECDSDISRLESEFIIKYTPLLNLDGNPQPVGELKRLRADCVREANQVK